MSLDLDIRNLLLTNQVKEINFLMAGATVSGHGYLELAHLFSDRPVRHRIRVTVRPQLVPRNAEAAYTSHDDKLHLRSAHSLTTAFGRGSVVHECTHAQLDLRGMSTPIMSEEAAAYIAEAWYRLACNEAVSTIASDITSAIVAVAQDLRQQASRAIGAPINLTPDQINTVRREVALMGYGTGHYINDGIRGYRYRGL
jgi:hypothetical protein